MCFRVRAVVLGDDRRKVVDSYDEAKLLAVQWSGDRKEELKVLPTRLSPSALADAEVASRLLSDLGLGFVEAAQWLVKNYTRPSVVEWLPAIAGYEKDRLKIGVSDSQVSNVVKAANRFAKFVGRSTVGSVTRLELEGFLATLPADVSATTYNGLLGDIGTFFGWLVTKGHLTQNPAEGMERRKVRRGKPQIMAPAAVEALMRYLEEHLPSWVPYAACCVFGAIRPGIREGEANRLNADLRAGKIVIHPGGIEIRGKANGDRIVPWKLCGPLKRWLEAYPPDGSLWPSAAPTIAEREWAKIRKIHKFPVADVLRHTGITAMCYAPHSSMKSIAIGCGTSEAKIRSNYLGRWSDEMTQVLYSILPNRQAKSAAA